MKKMVNGVLVDMTAEEIAERQRQEAEEAGRDRRPLAMGKDLITFIEEVKSELTRKEVKQILLKLDDGAFFRLLRQGRCNPLKQVDLDEEILELSKIFTKKENAVLVEVIESWKKSVKFIDDGAKK